MQRNSHKVTARQHRLRELAVAIFVLVCLTFGNTSARADWRTDLGAFRVGVIAGNDVAGTIARVEPFRLALSEALGMQVDIFPTKDYEALIEAQAGSRIEYAILSASAYAATWLVCECVEPLAIPQAFDQTTSYRAILIAGPSGPASIAQLPGSNVYIPDPETVGASAFALHELRGQGVDIIGQANTAIVKSAENSAGKLLADDSAAILGWSSMTGDPSTGYSRGTLRTLARRKGGKITGYRIIWKSADIPHAPHVIRKTLPAEVKNILRETLRSMFDNDPVAYDAIEPVLGGGFLTARHSQYESIIAFVAATTGIDGEDRKSVV